MLEIFSNTHDFDANNEFFHTGCRSGALDDVRLGIERGANVQLNGNISSPLFHACAYGKLEVIDYLFEFDADVGGVGAFGTLLHVCMNDHRSRRKGYLAATSLLNYGVDKDCLDSQGYSAMYYACMEGYTIVVELLSGMCLDLDILDKHGRSPLDYACARGFLECAKLLIEVGGANIDIRNGANGGTPLYVATEKGNTSIVQYLLAHHADVNLTNFNGDGPLHVACATGRSTIVSLLLDNNANHNQPNIYGFYPLHIAVQAGYSDVVNTLLTKNVSLDVTDANNQLPLELAKAGHVPEIMSQMIELIESHMGKREMELQMQERAETRRARGKWCFLL